MRDRFQELVDFATTQSPYKSANQGWINEDIYLQWGASREQSSKEGDELANVSFYWKPVNQIVLILFSVIIAAIIFVFFAVSLAHGRFDVSKRVVSTKSAEPFIETEVPKSVATVELSTPKLVEPLIEIEVPKSLPSIDAKEQPSLELVKKSRKIEVKPDLSSKVVQKRVKSTRKPMEWI